jgi:DNA-binding winged helix-turn-helix (wHTH) protein
MFPTGARFAYSFGPFLFEVDAATARLFRGRERLPLSAPQSAILLQLIANAGHVVSKDALAEAGWKNVAVTTNSVTQSVLRLRKVLEATPSPNTPEYIETIPNHGYRFIAPVERREPLDADSSSEAELAPYRAFVQGRADLYTLNRDAIRRARRAFEAALRLDPDYGRAHVGLANACALAFEATRVDTACDLEALQQAIRHARHGTQLSPSSGEAWSTLAFVLSLHGDAKDSAAAALKAIALEPGNWLHSLRLAYLSWGEARIDAARTVLKLCPGLALAHCLRASPW